MKLLVIIILLFFTIIEHSLQMSSVKTKFGCENTTISLTCPVGSYVSIVRANYGRFSISLCNLQAVTDIETNCSTEDNATALIRKK